MPEIIYKRSGYDRLCRLLVSTAIVGGIGYGGMKYEQHKQEQEHMKKPYSIISIDESYILLNKKTNAMKHIDDIVFEN